jgi:hypothetical protein
MYVGWERNTGKKEGGNDENTKDYVRNYDTFSSVYSGPFPLLTNNMIA